MDTVQNRPACCIITNNPRPCKVCGKLTNYVEYCVEQPLCSDECILAFYAQIYKGNEQK